ncbi:hypothetical protein GOP47_0015659 [Adiantum capillus-veneris]|uniref:SKP1-like protein n=1 Tax=Adiantum capillus-veneris TaxID=13818 RepID=A0A9D4UK20_ADICA|nr:hypothetical protein GOP47_0015659 [Adiantum capillus-veneris]
MASERPVLKLKSCEGKALQVQRGAALLSGFLKDVLNYTFCATDLANGGREAPIRIKFRSEGGAKGPDKHTLSKVIEYCGLQSSNTKRETGEHGRESWTSEETTYIDGLRGLGTDNTVFKVMMAADYMDIEGLLDLTCEAVADMIRNKSVEEIRELFNIQNDFDPAEEEPNLQSYAWAFENDDAH